MELRVYSITYEANGILSFDLRRNRSDDPPLPPFTAGAHIDLLLPERRIRSYSLVNPQEERHRYFIAVSLERGGRGGSRFMHEKVRPGDVLLVREPRNGFPLKEDAQHSVLIAGGIGITPILCMVRRLVRLGRSWELHYSARSRDEAAFLDEVFRLAAEADAPLAVNLDRESGRMLDISGIVKHSDPDAHLYCCGPEPMLNAFEAALGSRPRENAHVERFGVPPVPASSSGFRVLLARTGFEVTVPPGVTVLRALLDAGIDPPYSCEAGVCGMCQTRVLEGTPQHRDHVLTESEKAKGDVMMICCSGCVGERLVLDL